MSPRSLVLLACFALVGAYGCGSKSDGNDASGGAGGDSAGGDGGSSAGKGGSATSNSGGSAGNASGGTTGSGGSASGGAAGNVAGSGGNAAGAGGNVAGMGGAAGAAGAGGSAMDNHGDTAMFNFENGVDKWVQGHATSNPLPPGMTISQNTVAASVFKGTGSLKVEIDTTGDASMAVTDHDKWSRALGPTDTKKTLIGKTVHFRIWVPNDPKITMVQVFQACKIPAYKDEFKTIPNTRDAWVDFAFDTFSATTCTGILSEIGVLFYTAAGGTKFTAYIDSVGP
jgi:hypothetical protein